VETAEKIAEAYCRYIKHWFTIPDIRVKNNEIDLIAIDGEGNRAHIEMGFSVAGGFSKLKKAGYGTAESENSTRQAADRTNLDYLEKKKFNSPEVISELREKYGFSKDSYKKIVVAWSAEENALKSADENGIEVWLLPHLIEEIKSLSGRESGYYYDDTIRTLQLAGKSAAPRRLKEPKPEKPPEAAGRARGASARAWEQFISSLPTNMSSRTYTIGQISKEIDYDLEKEKAPTEYHQYWQSKHAHTEIWRQAGWKARPIRDPSTKKIVAVKFVRIAQGQFI
jgi:hypothetical protein